PSSSRSASPVQAPPYSPITPTLSNARPVFTHKLQPPPVAMPPAPPIEIDFGSNPDVLALKATMSILQQQKRTAERDIKALSDTKERALRDPDAFTTALKEGRIGVRGDELLHPNGGDTDEDEEMEDAEGLAKEEEGSQAVAKVRDGDKWNPLPTSQNVVRMPPINWEQYGVVGNALDKMHRDQVARPPQGVPQRMGPDGQFHAGPSDGQRKEYPGVAAPYNPLKDKIEK
ncbi:hypothetical protein BDZ45DRAFT_548525, partial [Acephala macrosclerotiorum]